MNASICFFDERIKTTFLSLASSAEEDRWIHAHLNAAFDVISQNAFCGVQIPKHLIPKPYLAAYGIDNLWKYNFHKSWRLMYSIASDGDHVMALIIEWLPHKEYERRFGY